MVSFASCELRHAESAAHVLTRLGTQGEIVPVHDDPLAVPPDQPHEGHPTARLVAGVVGRIAFGDLDQ